VESNKRVKFNDYDEEEVYDDRESYYDNEDYDDDEYREDEDFDDYDDEDDDYDDDYDVGDYDVVIKSNYETNGRSRREKKGKRVPRKELHDDDGSEPLDVYINKLTDKNSIIKPKIDKGKGVLRHEGQTQIGESSSLDHGYDTARSSEEVEEVNYEVFRPGPEELTKLEWSLNHKFFAELEIFGEGSSDSELSDCCDACIMEVDHT
jgi:hypothetical protein